MSLFLLAVPGHGATSQPDRPAAAATLESVLARIERSEARLRDVSLKFDQVTLLKATADTQTTTGELAVMNQPSRFRVRFLAPVQQVAVYDGSTLTLYFPDAAQAFRQTATAEQLSQMLGINPAEPVKSFRRGYTAALEGCSSGVCRLAFTRSRTADITWHVAVSSSTWLMSEAWFENAEVRVTLRCYDYRVNRRLSLKDFRLSLPSSVEVQEGMPQMMGAPRPTEGGAAPRPTEGGAAPRPTEGGAAPRPTEGGAAPRPTKGGGAQLPAGGAQRPADAVSRAAGAGSTRTTDSSRGGR